MLLAELEVTPKCRRRHPLTNCVTQTAFLPERQIKNRSELKLSKTCWLGTCAYSAKARKRSQYLVLSCLRRLASKWSMDSVRSRRLPRIERSPALTLGGDRVRSVDLSDGSLAYTQNQRHHRHFSWEGPSKNERAQSCTRSDGRIGIRR